MSEHSARPTLDLTKTIGELVSADPSLTESLTDIGFEDLPSDKTIPELSRAAGVETSVVALRSRPSATTSRTSSPTMTS